MSTYDDRPACPACGKEPTQRFGPDLLRCRYCGLAYYAVQMSSGTVAGLYGEDYFHGDEYYNYVEQRPALDANFRRRLRSIETYLQPNANIVELGCAYGFFLAIIRERVGSHIGFDISGPAVTYARDILGVKATTEDFLTWRSTDPVDMVFMWDFIEHVTEPEAFIAKCSAVLRPGGRIALTTGDIGAFVPRLRGVRWRMVHPPTHVFYFTVPALAAMMQRHGLKIVRVRHPAVWRNAYAMLDQVARARQHGVLADLGRHLPRLRWLQHIDVPLNLLDIMEVVAVKAGG